MSRSIKLTDLCRVNACYAQRKVFKELFPYGATFEAEDEAVAAAMSVANGFNWDWAANKLLSYAAFGAYKVATQEAREASNIAIERGWDAYDAALQEPKKAFNAVVQPSLEAYNEAAAEAFARAWWNDNDKEG